MESSYAAAVLRRAKLAWTVIHFGVDGRSVCNVNNRRLRQEKGRYGRTSLKMDTNNMIDRMLAQIPSMRFGLATAIKGTV